MPGLRSELGGSGVEFTNGFMTTPLCCPSRASILRGQYANITHVYTNSGPNGGADDFVPLEAETVGTLLEDAGYRTGFFGKYMNGYNQLWADSMHIPAGWTIWNAFRNVRYFDYDLIENGDGGTLRHGRRGLLDRRPAREGEAVHHRLGQPRPAVLPLPRVQGAARAVLPPVAAQRRVTSASTQASPIGGRPAATTSRTSPTSRPGCRTRRR